MTANVKSQPHDRSSHDKDTDRLWCIGLS